MRAGRELHLWEMTPAGLEGVVLLKKQVLRWLHKVYTEIEERFIRQAEEKRRIFSLNAAGRQA